MVVALKRMPLWNKRRAWTIVSLIGFLSMVLYLRVQTDKTGTTPATTITLHNERKKTSSPQAQPQKQVLKPAWPNPALVVGLPKAGTQSIADYFRCGCYKVSHYKNCNRQMKRNDESKCGIIIHENVLAGVDPLLNTGDLDVHAQLDIVKEKGVCYFPQMDALDEIHKHHPNSTFILNTRNATHWLSSVERWRGMRQRLVKCNLTDLPTGVGSRDEDMFSFFHKHIERIRNFCKKYPSHALVEIDVESNTTGAILERAFGIPSTCWGKNNHRGSHGGSKRKRSCKNHR